MAAQPGQRYPAVGAAGGGGGGGGSGVLNWLGAWSGATAYVVGDAVEDAGSSYVCTADHTNQEPPNASYWDLLAQKGTDGTDGTDGTNGTNGTNGTSGAQGFFSPANGMFVLPQGYNNTLNCTGITSPQITAPGGHAAVAFATTNYLTSQRRDKLNSSNADNSDAAWTVITGNYNVWRGNGAGLGGFVHRQAFGFDVLSPTSKGFFGVYYNQFSISLGTNSPTALTDLIGIGWEAGDSLMYLIHNDASGTATKTSTGETFVINKVYIVEVSCIANGSDMTVRLFSQNGAGETQIYASTVSTNIPVSTALLEPFSCLSSGSGGGRTASTLSMLWWSGAPGA